jgi:3-phenylpropionate/cinnamic acid dioxygenase small subunit
VVSDAAGHIGLAGLVRADDPEYADALMFLIAEAEVLDSADFAGWLTLVAPEIRYTVPVQTSLLRGDAETADGSARSYHLNEDRASLEFRVKRIVESDSSWAYNPRSRTRRFVSNLRVRRGESSDLLVVSNLQLMRSRHDLDTYDLITAERHDVLGRRADGELELCSREITVDQARLGIAPIPFPL